AEEWSKRRQGELFDAMLDAFSASDVDLKAIWSFELEMPGAEYPAGRPGKDTIFHIVESCQERGLLTRLESAVFRLRPENHKVKKYRQTYAALEVADSIIHIKSFQDGRTIILRFYREDFHVARDRIYTLNGYKIIHDCLHNLQVTDLSIIGDDVDL